MNKSKFKMMAALTAASLVMVACGSDDDAGSSDAPAETDASTDADTDAPAETDADAGDAPAVSGLINTDDCADPEAATAPIDGNIKVAWSAPLSGPLANAVGSVLDGMNARFKQVNDAGGIDGHQIELLAKDDAFDPERAKSNIAELIEVDKVHVLDVFGSGQLNAVADDQNIACVPLLFAQATAPEYRDAEEYPWTTEYLASTDVEMQLIANRIQADYPDGSTVALAVNPTGSGVALSEGFKNAVEGTNIEIVEEADLTDPDAAATTLSLSEAQVVVNAGVAADCLALTTAIARVGWTPELVIQPSNCTDGVTLYAPAGDAADGQLVMKWLKEPGNPLYVDDAVADYEAALADYGVDAPDSFTVNGWVTADLMVDVFVKAAASDIGLSRLGIMETARTQSYAPPMFIDGVTWEMTPEDSLGIISLQPMTWNAAEQYFDEAGEVVSLG